MKQPRAELSSRQLAAQDPTELQALWRKQFVLQGQLAAITGWNNAFKQQLSEAQRSCHPHLNLQDTRKFGEVQREINKVLWSLIELQDVVKAAHEKARQELKVKLLNAKDLGVSL